MSRVCYRTDSKQHRQNIEIGLIFTREPFYEIIS